jgi:SAM-dependent methyltransferase
MPAPDLERIKDYNETDYSTVWQGAEAAFSGRFESALAERLLSDAPGWFMDLGAGYGRLYPLYARPGRKVVMVDYAANLLEGAAAAYRGEPDVHFVAANAYHLPFRDRVFAAGISIRTFHHMASPQTFLDEVGRVLRGGAHFLLEYSNKRNLPRIARFGGRSLRRDHEEYAELLFGTHPALFAELASAAGLRVEQALGTGFFSRFATDGEGGVNAALSALESGADALLGSLAPMTFADLVCTDPAPGDAVGGELLDILGCPACRGALGDTDEGVRCESCGTAFRRSGRVLDLRHVGTT